MTEIPFHHFLSEPTGSRVICPGAVRPDSDYDTLVLTGDRKTAAETAVLCGWAVETDESYNGAPVNFSSARKGDQNLIITDKLTFYEQFRLATAIARHLNLVRKADRIVLFRSILYGEFPPADIKLTQGALS